MRKYCFVGEIISLWKTLPLKYYTVEFYKMKAEKHTLITTIFIDDSQFKVEERRLRKLKLSLARKLQYSNKDTK